VAETDAVVRFPYENGDLQARGPPETILPRLTPSRGGHWTRDVVFSADGARMFVSVGSASNVAEQMPGWPSARIRDWEEKKGLGAAWGEEAGRACVREFDPSGAAERLFASGIRNCVGLAVAPSGDLWCATNERDGLGDDLVPDYVTPVRPGAFYGWPWFYLGDQEDPRHANERPDLRGKVRVPDVLLQPHSAPLQLAFYDGKMFPREYQGDVFVALHGSWNRSRRTGYKIVRLPVHDGVPAGEYEDFVTGFVADDDAVWGRPVGIAVAHDGALVFSEDGNGTLWRVSVAREATAKGPSTHAPGPAGSPH
jgi:glucose/arabinose dehydrogenase